MDKAKIANAIKIFGFVLMFVGFTGLIASMCSKDSTRKNTPAEEQRMKDLLK